MPKEVIDELMKHRNPRTGKNYTRQEAEAIYFSVKAKGHALTLEDVKHDRKR